MASVDRSGGPPLHLEVRDLRLVLAVAEAGTLSRAAGLLHLAQSTLSHHLAELEGRLGGTLFHRRARRLALTPLGVRFRDGAAPLLGSLRGLEQGLHTKGTSAPVDLRVATECYTTYPWLARVLRDFHARFPGARVRPAPEATRHPLQALRDGAIELALVSDRPRERRFVTRVLFEDELVAVVAKDHPWAGRPRVVPADFRDVHLLTYAPDPTESSFVRQTLLKAGVRPREMSGVPLTEGLVELAAAGVGVAVLARWAVEREIRSRRVRVVRIGRDGVKRTWHAVRLRAALDPELIDALAAAIAHAGATLGR